ncbi:MAG: hypothetical protein K2P14_03870 [Anaeroplasmataceae bacterium]|nr:hypothetical protein [Anaeroplasmataceae bacterium]
MKLLKIIKEEYKKDVKHFGKIQTIILYVQFLIVCLIAVIGCILGLIDEKLQSVSLIILFSVGDLFIFYLIMICLIAKFKRTRLLLTLKCIEEGENITYKYNSHISIEDVPELLIRSSLAMLKYNKEEALKILNEVCNNPDTPVDIQEGVTHDIQCSKNEQ